MGKISALRFLQKKKDWRQEEIRDEELSVLSAPLVKKKKILSQDEKKTE
jgi:hypothetical protein